MFPSQQRPAAKTQAKRGIPCAHGGNIAFGQVGVAAIGTINTSGQYSTVPIPTTATDANPFPVNMTTGPDGSVVD